MTDWHSSYLAHPLYRPIRRAADWLTLTTWPDQASYDRLAAVARERVAGFPAVLRFVADLEPEAYYEAHIGATGEVPTRLCNWHDWFNALAWCAWPRAKSALNARHLRALARGEVKRGSLRDAATLFDECGVVLAVSDERMADALKDMDWATLFLARREGWGRAIAPFVLGHALSEQGLTPHIGWCGKALLLPVPPAFFSQTYEAQLAQLDASLAERLADDTWLARPRELLPLPLLGIPGWWTANEDPAFYANTDYFRPSRRANSSSVMSSELNAGDSRASSASATSSS
ncbi:DUF3025 domain-containing protein [Crenobacter sp. SG2303]|uniref:DUF3025 domain-containing protein n=1 Tax=Crenobacter oryzisoli TaxID=3056844 RepID=A0ABT7XM61_9NEIS|nr:DUF3025 domain-containing protein [Crenobacter sp. SG2303]MDN0074798.1 DUF3025 domain-containing protein [Crenobacter sp. SG2303]